jgi:Sulfotransferase family
MQTQSQSLISPNDSKQNWIPSKLTFRNGALMAKWQFVGDLSFAEPFFEGVIQKSKQLEENKQDIPVMTTLDVLSEIAEKMPHIAPDAFIFHVSRCGSTLMTQLLGLNERNVVVSEPSVLDEALREFAFKINPQNGFDPNLQATIRMIGRRTLPNDSMEDMTGNRGELDEETIEKTIQAIVKTLGQKRSGNEEKLFIKLDSWHIFYYEKLRKLYPNTPFVFSYRRPDEVIRSQMQSNGMHSVPGLVLLELFGMDFFQLNNESTEVFVAKILEKYHKKFLSIIANDTNVLFVNYKDGIMKNMDKIADYLGLTFDDDLRQNMIKRTQFHSKSPNTVFVEKPLEGKLPEYLKNVFLMYEELVEQFQ